MGLNGCALLLFRLRKIKQIWEYQDNKIRKSKYGFFYLKPVLPEVAAKFL